jgi:hypothetical protein
MIHIKLFEEFNDDSTDIKVIVSKKYSIDQAERLISNLEDIHNISGQFIDWTDDGRVILELSADGTWNKENFLEFIENSEYFDKII